MNTELDVGRLYNDFRNPLKAFISKRVANHAAAEDLLHDIFLRIHNQIHQLKEPEKVSSWIYQIARNTIIDFYRKKREFVEDSHHPAFFEPNEIKDASEQLVPVVQAMIEKLPDKYKEPLLLSDFQGMKQDEIAKRLGISLSGAKSRIQRARNMLKDILLECCHFEFDRYGTVFDFQPRNCTDCC